MSDRERDMASDVDINNNYNDKPCGGSFPFTQQTSVSEASAELVCARRGLGAANANLRTGDRRVGLKAGACLEGLAAMVGHARRVRRRVTV